MESGEVKYLRAHEIGRPGLTPVVLEVEEEDRQPLRSQRLPRLDLPMGGQGRGTPPAGTRTIPPFFARVPCTITRGAAEIRRALPPEGELHGALLRPSACTSTRPGPCGRGPACLTRNRSPQGHSLGLRRGRPRQAGSRHRPWRKCKDEQAQAGEIEYRQNQTPTSFEQKNPGWAEGILQRDRFVRRGRGLGVFAGSCISSIDALALVVQRRASLGDSARPGRPALTTASIFVSFLCDRARIRPSFWAHYPRLGYGLPQRLLSAQLAVEGTGPQRRSHRRVRSFRRRHEGRCY
jgi:hypothetical protein